MKNSTVSKAPLGVCAGTNGAHGTRPKCVEDSLIVARALVDEPVPEYKPLKRQFRISIKVSSGVSISIKMLPGDA